MQQQQLHSKPFCLIPKDFGPATILHPIRSWTRVPKTIYDWTGVELNSRCVDSIKSFWPLCFCLEAVAHTWNQLNDHYFDSQASKPFAWRSTSVWLIYSPHFEWPEINPVFPERCSEKWCCFEIFFFILKVFPHWEDGTSDLVDTPGLKIENNVLDVGGDTRGRGRRLVWCE